MTVSAWRIAAVCAITLAGSVVLANGSSPAAKLSATMTIGSTYLITGQTGTIHAGDRRATGMVTLTEHWVGGSRQIVVHRRTDSIGRFMLRIHPSHHGTLRFTVATPDIRTTQGLLQIVLDDQLAPPAG